MKNIITPKIVRIIEGQRLALNVGVGGDKTVLIGAKTMMGPKRAPSMQYLKDEEIVMVSACHALFMNQGP